jgi:hypothetical protein
MGISSVGTSGVGIFYGGIFTSAFPASDVLYVDNCYAVFCILFIFSMASSMLRFISSADMSLV